MADTPTPNDIPTLEEALNFTADDLTVNRAGKLSAEQQSMLRNRAGIRAFAANGMSLLLAVGGFWLLGQGFWPWAALLFASAGALFYFSSRGRAAASIEVNVGDIAIVSGEAVLTTDDVSGPERKVTEHILTVGDESFVISRYAFAAFEDGDHYHVYYLPAARIILSAEPISS
ncbi:MAG: hypothetical protein AAF787_00945 [Chloroflexota bacterium]